jgi:hypothetical protein
LSFAGVTHSTSGYRVTGTFGAALPARCQPSFAGSLPEAERAVGDRPFRPHIEPAPFQIVQQIALILRTFARAVGEADGTHARDGSTFPAT